MIYRGAGKSLATLGRKQTNISARMVFASAPCLERKKKTWWQLASRCCRNRARPWHASKLFSFLVGLRTYNPSIENAHADIRILTHSPFCVLKFTFSAPHKRFSGPPLRYILGLTSDHGDDMQFPLKKNECSFLPESTGCLPSNYV